MRLCALLVVGLSSLASCSAAFAATTPSQSVSPPATQVIVVSASAFGKTTVTLTAYSMAGGARHVRLGAVIAYNRAHVPGRGSAIFLHVGVGGPTAGCVALPVRELLQLLLWLDPARSPLIEMGVGARAPKPQ